MRLFSLCVGMCYIVSRNGYNVTTPPPPQNWSVMKTYCLNGVYYSTNMLPERGLSQNWTSLTFKPFTWGARGASWACADRIMSPTRQFTNVPLNRTLDNSSKLKGTFFLDMLFAYIRRFPAMPYWSSPVTYPCVAVYMYTTGLAKAKGAAAYLVDESAQKGHKGSESRILAPRCGPSSVEAGRNGPHRLRDMMMMMFMDYVICI